MSLLQDQRKPSHPATRSSNSINKTKQHSAVSTAYIELKSRPMSKTSLFVAYFNHMFYFSNERGVMFRLLRGIVSGRPALDIQLIHGTSDIADRREATERALMQEVASLASSSAEQASQSSPTLSPVAAHKRLTIPRSVRALKASPTFAESIAAAWAGNEHQAFEDHSHIPSHISSARLESVTSSPHVHSRELETDTLLVGERGVGGRSASVPRSVHCRTLSRRMLFILLFTLFVNFIMSMTGMTVFILCSELRSTHGEMNGGVVHLRPVGGTVGHATFAHNMNMSVEAASATLAASSALASAVSS